MEALAALTIFGLAVIVAAGFLDAHMTAARRLEARAELVRATERVLESARGGAVPLVSGAVPVDELGTVSSIEVTTSVEVAPRSIPGLFEVRAEARATVRGEEMVVSIATQVWRP